MCEEAAMRLKYKNKPQTADGIKFASKAELRRYGELKLMEKAKEITDLKVHPEYYLQVNGIQICRYVGDFAYWTNGEPGTRRYIVEDVKGVRTRTYSLKKKLMFACLQINVEEIDA